MTSIMKCKAKNEAGQSTVDGGTLAPHQELEASHFPAKQVLQVV